MKRIKLTERELINIINRVINETEDERLKDLDRYPPGTHGPNDKGSARRGSGSGKQKMAPTATPAAAPPACPPPGPTSGPTASPYYTNWPEFCLEKNGVLYHQQPGMTYHGHPDGACCP